MAFVARRVIAVVASRSVAPDVCYATCSTVQLQQCRFSHDAAPTSTGKSIEETSTSSSIATDAFLSHLQHKTENDLLDLLSRKDKDRSTDESAEDGKVTFVVFCFKSLTHCVVFSRL